MLLCRFLLPDTMARNADDSPEDDISNVHPSLFIAIPDSIGAVAVPAPSLAFSHRISSASVQNSFA